MAYKPCSFDRQAYLDNEDIFKSLKLDDVEQELAEFSDDAEDLAYELAYTRYRVAKLEQEKHIIEE